MEMCEANLQRLLAERARTGGRRPALLFGTKSITYEEVDKESNRLANGLRTLDVSPGTKVAIMLPNIPQFVYAFFAIQKLGAIAVPMNTLYKAGEILHVLRDSEAEVIITLSNYVPAIQEILHETNLRHIVSVGERDLVFAHPSCRFAHLILNREGFDDSDAVYRRMGETLLHIVKQLGVSDAWYKHRGSVRVNGNRLGGIAVQETENDYVITLNVFTDTLDVDDFLEVIWVPPEIRDRIVEPLTSIREETDTVVTHEMFRDAVLSALRRVMGTELDYGKLTRDESFAHQRRKGLSKR